MNRKLRPAALLVPLSLALTSSAGATWSLVDNFETGFTPGSTINGISGWVTDVAATALAKADPAGSGRGTVLHAVQNATRNDIYKSILANQIANNSTGTLFFEAYLPASGGTANINLGASDLETPDNYAAYEAQFRFDALNISPRKGAAFTDTGYDANTGEWIKVWLVMNNTTDKVDMYVQRPSEQTGQILVADDYGFRNGTTASLQTFLLIQGAGRDVYVDNIYIDDSGQNLADPTDGDNDGMDDFFENQYFGDTSRDGTLDFDSDNLSDLDEFANFTNPTNPDSDGDTLLDGDEVTGTSNAYDASSTDPLDADSDNDGLTDAEENGSLNTAFANQPTDPKAADTDGDGMPDPYELANNTPGTALNPNDDGTTTPDFDPTQAPGADRDADTLTNLAEYSATPQTRADLADTDGDSLTDEKENTSGTWVSATNTGTNPTLADTDLDGIPDNLENLDLGSYQGAGITPCWSNPSLDDTDGDTFLDGIEITAGTDPNDIASLPATVVGFNLIEDFEDAAFSVGNTFVGINGWAAGIAPRALTATDPAASERGNVGLLVQGPFNDVDKGFGQFRIPEGATGTLFFEIYLASSGTPNISCGASDLVAPPNDFGAFEAQFRLANQNIEPRNGAAFADTGFDSRIAAWMKVWLVANNAADTIDIYVQSPAGYASQTLVADDYAFRNGTTDALASFLAIQGTSADVYIDNIHIDPTGENLADPTDGDGDGIDDFWEMLWFGDLDQDETTDFDIDNLADLGEFLRGTDPTDDDSDNDTLLDGNEVAGTSNAFDASPTDPLDADSDNDGVNDFEEVGSLNTAFANAPTDPHAADTDGDGMPDRYELDNQTTALNALDPNDAGTTDPSQDPFSGDRDGDGLYNLEEYNPALGPNPASPQTRADTADTDADGWNDYAESNTGIWAASDNTGTNPIIADSDGDGLLDGEEDFSLVSFPGAGITPTNSNPNSRDSDGDGFIDRIESELGSDPASDASVPAQASGFVLVEDFEAPGFVIGQSFDGVNGWSVGQPAATTIADEPIAGGDKIACIENLTTDYYSVYKSLDELNLQVLEGGTGTVFMQVFCASPEVNCSFGLSDVVNPPNNVGVFAAFEAQAVAFRDAVIRLRDGVNFRDPGYTYPTGRWMNLWIVADNQNDTMTVHWETPTGESGRIEVTDDGGVDPFDFRNGTGEALKTVLFGMAVDTENGAAVYVDNIYLDPTAENLSTPAAAKPTPPAIPILSVSRNGNGDLEIKFAPGGPGYVLTSSPDLQSPFAVEPNASYDDIDTFTLPNAFIGANPSHFFRVEESP